jgi:SAM-dependent methyltransferase
MYAPDHPTASSYDDIVDFYDTWTSMSATAQNDTEFYAEHCLHHAGPILELGVGTGRIAVNLAERGATVVGVDLSPRMLSAALRRASERGVAHRLTLCATDFSVWLPNCQPAAIYAPFHALSHLPHLGAVRSTLRLAAALLEPGGTFAFNVPHQCSEHIAELDGVEQLVTDTAAGAARLRVTVTVHADHVNRRQASTVHGTLREPQGRALLEHRWDLPLIWISTAEIENEAAVTGFEVESVAHQFSPTGALFPDEKVVVLRRR